ncbi:MAG: hypothetical protein IJZ93_05520 [Clostridia bacterium]|nr:hypothetical protein [Clostridia bacterium]
MNSNNKIAILILAHKNPYQINTLIDSLYHKDIDIYLHIDKKSSVNLKDIKQKDNLFILEENSRVNVSWGQISQLDATLNLIKKAHLKEYIYYILISGEDFPCKSIDKIIKVASLKQNRISFWESENNAGKFNNLDKRCSVFFPKWMITRKPIRRIIKRLWVFLSGGYNHTFKIFKRKNNNIKFYHGPSWWGLNFETIDFIINYLEKNPKYYKFFKNCSNPDESFFQTTVMLSPQADTKTEYLTYLNFLPGKNSPEVLSESDCIQAYNSKYYFMRKIDLNKTNIDFLNQIIMEKK